MVRRALVTLLALIASAICTPVSASLLAEQPYRIGYSGRLVTDVMIDDQGPFTFVIDTASSSSLMFEHVRDQLKLTQSQPKMMTVYGINDVASAMPVKPGELRIAGEVLHGLTLGVLPDLGRNGPDGVLGIDVLSRYFVVLDRATMRLKLLTPGPETARAYAGWSETMLVLRPLKKFSISFWYVATRFNDRTVTSLFDLGAGMTMLNWRAAEELGVAQSKFAVNGPPPEILQDVLGKKAPAIRLQGLSIRLPGRYWQRQMVIVADAPVFEYFDLDGQPAAIVGPGLLQANSLAIDFAGHRLFVGPTMQ